MSDLFLQMFAGVTVAAFVREIYAWHKRDKEARINAALAANRRAWAKEIERAGRRLMEADRLAEEERERRKILRAIAKKKLKVKYIGDAIKYAAAWEDTADNKRTGRKK